MYSAKFEKELIKEKDIVQIICIMDGSGSMYPIIAECVGAFNKFVDSQKKLKGDAELTLVAFDEDKKIVYDKVNIQEVGTLDEFDVFLGGSTALYDAIGLALKNADDDKKTICLIQTDGHENASQEYKANTIKDLIKEKEALGWEFIFIGAGIDAFEEGKMFGLKAHQTRSIAATGQGISNYGGIITSEVTDFRKKV